jgi:hypothetical protein
VAMKFLKGMDGHTYIRLGNASRVEPAPQLIILEEAPTRKMEWLFNDVVATYKVTKHRSKGCSTDALECLKNSFKHYSFHSLLEILLSSFSSFLCLSFVLRLLQYRSIHIFSDAQQRNRKAHKIKPDKLAHG